MDYIEPRILSKKDDWHVEYIFGYEQLEHKISVTRRLQGKWTLLHITL